MSGVITPFFSGKIFFRHLFHENVLRCCCCRHSDVDRQNEGCSGGLGSLPTITDDMRLNDWSARTISPSRVTVRRKEDRKKQNREGTNFGFRAPARPTGGHDRSSAEQNSDEELARLPQDSRNLVSKSWIRRVARHLSSSAGGNIEESGRPL